ncbi:MAG: molybdenum cofactor guanylyltransferase MobA [Lentilitoribacter sp.]
MNILGAIIAGGQSRRMAGANKLFLKLQGEFLVERAARKLNQQVGQVVVNLNRDEDAVKSFGHHIILDEHNDHQGPLAGIYSVLNWVHQNHDKVDYVMTVPADAPFFPDDLSKVLSDAIGANDIAIAHYDGYPQQLFGLWSVKCLKDLALFLDNLDNRKVMSFIRSKNWVQVEVKKQQVDPFMNINTPEDWQMAQDFVAKRRDC